MKFIKNTVTVNNISVIDKLVLKKWSKKTTPNQLKSIKWNISKTNRDNRAITSFYTNFTKQLEELMFKENG